MNRFPGLLKNSIALSCRRIAPAALLAPALLAAGMGYAQSTTSARLTGAVTDPSGAAVPHVKIAAKNLGTGLTVTAESDSAGNYAFNSLPVGDYQVTATGTGFSSLVETGITLGVSQNVTLNLPLKIGGSSDSVTVEGGADLINTTTAELGQTVDEATIKDLPLNGRDPGTLVFLSAGVTNELNSQASTLQSTNSFPNESGASAGGQRQGSTWYLLDGVSHMDTYTLLALPFPNPDATQEFRVISNNFDARNGFAPSAIVSIQTKSGSNKYHGGVFEFLRNGYVNAANPFSGPDFGTPKAVDGLHRNQFGGDIGGHVPYFKDKLFFFANYQGTRESSQSNTNTAITPTAAERSGDFTALLNIVDQNGVPAPLVLPAPFVNNKIDPSRYSQGAMKLLNYIPTGGTGGVVNFAFPPQVTKFDEFTGRLDYDLNDKQRVFVRSFTNKYNQEAQSIPNNILAGVLGSNGFFLSEVANHTWTINPTTLNTLAVGYVSYSFHSGSPLLNSSGQPICLSQFINVADPPSACYIEDLNVLPGGSYSSYAPATGFSSFSSNPFNTKRQDYSLTETFTKTLGHHTITVGGDLFHRHHTENSQFNESPVIGFNGQYNHGIGDGNPNHTQNLSDEPFADFLLGEADSFSQGAEQAVATSQWMFGVYGQDQWKVTPKLTATLGLRWDPNTPAVIAGGQGTDFIPGEQSTRFPNAPLGFAYPGDPGVPDSLYYASYTYFEPRIGIAWTPNPTLAVRAAFGIFTTPMEDAFYQRVQGAPFTANYGPGSSVTQYIPFDNPWSVWGGAPGYAAGKSPFPPFLTPDQNPPSNTTYGFGQGATISATFDPHLKLGETQSWNLSLEQQFGKSNALHLAYVGSESFHQATTVDLNPGTTGVAGQADPNRGIRTNPNLGLILQVQDGGTASYSSLQAGIEHKFSHGFQFQSNFTWSRTTDVGGSGDPDFESSVSDPLDVGHDKGTSSLNVPLVWVTYGIYKGPTFEGHNWAVKNFLGGWELSAIFTAESGEPFTINGGGGNNLSGFDEGQDRADRVAGQPLQVRTGGKGHWLNNYFNTNAFQSNEIGTPGNSMKYLLQSPPDRDMDATFIKNIALPEGVRAQLRWDMFNATNTPSYGQPDNNPGDSNPGATQGNFGQIGGIGPVKPRVMQAAVKITF
jgi:outer membrane receptor protein involved in Fe transport